MHFWLPFSALPLCQKQTKPRDLFLFFITNKLVYLAEIVDLSMAEKYLKFLGILDAIGPSARYPKDLQAALKSYKRPRLRLVSN
jgi:hypothetical protein